jgi:EAL domain-containing protein (putative c-di-GMP-specific phosphodiesterase class I)
MQILLQDEQLDETSAVQAVSHRPVRDALPMDWETSVRAASLALASAKNGHRQSAETAGRADNINDWAVEAAERSRLVADMGKALTRNRLQLALQPVVDARSGRVAFFEGLMRLEQIDGGLASAGAGIQAAEHHGFIRAIDRRTLQLALEILDRSPDISLSINLSALTCADRQWLDMLRENIAANQDLAPRLIIEITETAEIGDLQRAIAFVDDVKRLGCRVALDDFGAGFTSFDSLTDLALDIVKIDGGFIRNIAHSADDRAFVKAIVGLAGQVGIKTVAEWVIDAEGARIVRDLGVDYVQGFLFGRPRPAADIIAMTRLAD